MKRRAGLIAAAIAGVALISGCAIHPGAAAVVDGRTISVDSVDTSAEAYCKLGQGQQQQQQQQMSTADARKRALGDLIVFTVVKDLAEDKGLDLDSEEWKLGDDEREQLTQAFDESELPSITRVVERSKHIQAIQEELGKHEAGDDDDDDAGSDAILEAVDASDVSVDPRFGLDDDLEQEAVTGSLSVPEVGEEESAAQLAQNNPCE